MGCICNKEIDWQTITDDTKLFSFENEQIQAKVVSVYDGDTVKCVFPSNGKMYKWNCRLTGVDTPELRTLCKVEKKFGYEVRDYLREKILNPATLGSFLTGSGGRATPARSGFPLSRGPFRARGLRPELRDSTRRTARLWSATSATSCASRPTPTPRGTACTR